MDAHKKGVVVLSTYARADLLSKCLKSIESAYGFEEVDLLVIHQVGFDDVKKVLEKHKNNMRMLVTVRSKSKSALYNINRNRLLSYLMGFNLLNADWVFGVEEDVEIHKNALNFISKTFDFHHTDRYFRGINLGSRNLDREIPPSSYSKLRYGLHGQAGVISRKTWSKISLNQIMREIHKEPLDGLVESYLKTGYMVTPNHSMFIDRGWNGTHAPSDSADPYYSELKSSFELNGSENGQFDLHDIEPNWREDCIVFHHKADFEFKLRHAKFRLKFFLPVKHKVTESQM